MKSPLLRAIGIAAAFAFLVFQPALAHEEITVGDYIVEVGWLSEPPVAGQMNAIVVNVSAANGDPVEDVSQLVVRLVYGDQGKTLRLQPLGEDTPGQYLAPVLPAIPGQYTVELSGSIGETQVAASVQPESVSPPEEIQFPLNAGTSQPAAFGLSGWLAVLGVILGLAGTALGLAGLRNKP